MADTFQCVHWALERPCPFRTGEDWFLPHVTEERLFGLRVAGEAEADGRIVDGICISGQRCGEDSTGRSHLLPYSGFRIDEALARFGGLAKAAEVCGLCEANCVHPLYRSQVAGCYCSIHEYPDSEELDEALWEVIREQGLEDRLRRAFHVTAPLWYGLWIESPLRRAQAELLLELLDPVFRREGEPAHDRAHFLAALKTSITWELPLHVSLSPLGHTHLFGMDIYPHCPRCKAVADGPGPPQGEEARPEVCFVCGNTFLPAKQVKLGAEAVFGETASVELEPWLGEAAYNDLAKKFIVRKGGTQEQADEVLDNSRVGPLRRRIAAVREKRRATLDAVRQAAASREGNDLPPRLALALSDDVALELVLVPAGEFLMGGVPERDDDCRHEIPRHSVRIARPFYLGRFPVTQAQWAAVVGGNPSRFRGDPDLPVEAVNWFAAQEFCERLCRRLRRPFRLPSEAEWEYACRAGTTTAYAFGDVLGLDQANFTPAEEFEASFRLRGPKFWEAERWMTPVGSYPPNGWGLYDMHGNVEEWCEDDWHDDYVGAPADGSPWVGGQEWPMGVLRGGWCAATERVCTSAARRYGVRMDSGAEAGHDMAEERVSAQKGRFRRLYLDISGEIAGLRVVCEFM
jgi:formylglycine-generating enzyme required for sulfatase activity